MLTQVSQQALAKVPQADRLRRGLLEKAAEFYRVFLEEQAHDPSLSYQTVLAYARLGKLEDDLGDLHGRSEPMRKRFAFSRRGEVGP